MDNKMRIRLRFFLLVPLPSLILLSFWLWRVGTIRAHNKGADDTWRSGETARILAEIAFAVGPMRTPCDLFREDRDHTNVGSFIDPGIHPSVKRALSIDL